MKLQSKLFNALGFGFIRRVLCIDSPPPEAVKSYSASDTLFGIPVLATLRKLSLASGS